MKINLLTIFMLYSSYICASHHEQQKLPPLFLDNSSFAGMPMRTYFSNNKDYVSLQELNSGLHDNKQKQDWSKMQPHIKLSPVELVLVKTDKTLTPFEKEGWKHEEIVPYVCGVAVEQHDDEAVIQIDLHESILAKTDDILILNKPLAKQVNVIGFTKPIKPQDYIT